MWSAAASDGLKYLTADPEVGVGPGVLFGRALDHLLQRPARLRVEGVEQLIEVDDALASRSSAASSRRPARARCWDRGSARCSGWRRSSATAPAPAAVVPSCSGVSDESTSIVISALFSFVRTMSLDAPDGHAADLHLVAAHELVGFGEQQFVVRSRPHRRGAGRGRSAAPARARPRPAAVRDSARRPRGAGDPAMGPRRGRRRGGRRPRGSGGRHLSLPRLSECRSEPVEGVAGREERRRPRPGCPGSPPTRGRCRPSGRGSRPGARSAGPTVPA